jgi:hypothetical protein
MNAYHIPTKPARAIPDARLRHLARRLHALGERPLYEFIREVVAGRDLIEHLERYADLPGDFIKGSSWSLPEILR